MTSIKDYNHIRHFERKIAHIFILQDPTDLNERITSCHHRSAVVVTPSGSLLSVTCH